MTNEVVDLLIALNEGTISIEEVAHRFKQRTWPRHRGSEPTTYTEMAAAQLEDPDTYIPGSFDDVTAAYHRGELSEQQYDVLANAMAESRRAEDAAADQ
ncbi:MAG TPA: hypothetical protein VNF47_01470 [Streptosporangiaceae bacterium]|nr:hypothetical protein [Streptosporangiaceae bacterium]